MKKTILVHLVGALFVLFLNGCSSSAPKTSGPGRKPASETQLDSAKIIKQARMFLDAHYGPSTKKFRVVRFPLNGPEDAHPIGADRAVMDLMEKMKESMESLSPMYTSEASGFSTMMDQRDRLRNIFLSGLTRKERDDFLALCFSSPAHVGAVFTAVSVIVDDLMCRYSGLLHSQTELEEALRAFPAKPTGVRYDGRIGFHVYSDKKLENQVQIITAAVNTHLHRFYELFMAQDIAVKEKFRENKEGTAEEDKVEPFDLISSYTTYLFIGKNMGRDDDSNEPLNKIQISKLAQKALARMFHMKDDNAPWARLPNMIVNKSDNALSILCANGLPESQLSTDVGGYHWHRNTTGTELLESWQPSMNMQQILEGGHMTAKISCNSRAYNFRIEKVPAQPIPPPSAITFARGQELNALMTVSLVNEIDRSAVEQARTLARLFIGWEAVSDVLEVNTREFLREELIKADAYFPVMHAMDVNYFSIGTEKGLALRLRKTVDDGLGGQRVLNLAILLPDGAKDLSTVVMKPEELAKMVHERYLKKPTPLFLMNNSCGSEKTLFGWTLIFREALKLRIPNRDNTSYTSVVDFPHIIGSRRSFGTASLAEIFSHSDYPLRSLEMLGQGKPVPEIVEFLKSPVKKGFLEGIASMFGGGSKTYDTQNESQGFDPVYIMDHPELLSLGGIRVFVKGEMIRGEDRY